MTDTQCKQLLDDIDFDDPLEYSPNTSLLQKEKEKKQQKEQVSILAPFT